MTERKNPGDPLLPVAEQAAEWLQRLEQGGTPRDRAEFVQWLKESRGHVREVLLAAATDRVLGHLDPKQQKDLDLLVSAASAACVPIERNLEQGSKREPSGRRVLRRLTWAAAAGFVVAALGIALFAGIRLNGHTYRTAVGEQRAIELPDGSVISLNTRSSVRVRFSSEARDVYLEDGQALFAVAHEPQRPFRVHAGPTLVRAIGTKFDVRRRRQRTDVAVLEGVVQVETAPLGVQSDSTIPRGLESARLTAGQAVSITIDGVTPPAPIQIAEINAWQQRRLIFRNDTLGEIVEEFNRYNRSPQIRLDDEHLATWRYSGVFDADDPESLIEYLVSEGLDVQSAKGTFVIRRKNNQARRPQA
ncbi:MAG TPA: FecR domain-containing protein [Steroidobacteraceae bacterium]|jgi:transmembrane sensor